MKNDEKEIDMVENENGEYVTKDTIKQTPKVGHKYKVRSKRPMNYAYITRKKNDELNFEKQFMGGFETGLRIVKKVNNYLKELK